MINRIRKQLGSAGLAVGVIALVVALAGTAIAAKSVFTKQQEKQIVKIAKKYAGKNGAPGPPGTPGAQGQVGPKGDSGARGPEGPEGKEGAEGIEGPEGSPWTAGGTLPSGESLSGNWAAGLSNPVALGAISFGIPLEAKPAVAVVPFEGSNAKCPGTLTSPAADAGTLCIYLNEGTSASPENIEESAQPNQAGAIISIFGSPAIGSGTWAVTAP